jgi:hypothetical protein
MKSTLLASSLIWCVLAIPSAAQTTRIDLRTQSKDVDFSGANSTKPFRTGTQLPATCSIGETFLKMDASLGQNLYVCTAADLWTRQGGAGMVSQLNDFAVTWTNPTVLTLGASCGSATPCNVRIGSTVYSYAQSCTATISAGTGTAYIYLTSTGVLTIGHNVTVASSSGCFAQAGVTSFPPDSIPLYTWTATNGTWDTSGGADYRAMLGSRGIAAGAGLVSVDSAGRTTLSVDGLIVPTYLIATAALDFPSIPAGTCAADLTFALAGAVVSDSVAPGWPNALDPGLFGLMRISSANTVAVRLCNLTGSAIDPASATYRATVVKGF